MAARGSATLFVPGRPKRKSWIKRTEDKISQEIVPRAARRQYPGTGFSSIGITVAERNAPLNLHLSACRDLAAANGPAEVQKKHYGINGDLARLPTIGKCNGRFSNTRRRKHRTRQKCENRCIAAGDRISYACQDGPKGNPG